MSEPRLKGQFDEGTQQLFALARASRERSYSPYSGFKVGAALRLSNGKTFGGCNVENSSYGGAVCAERTAILKAVSETPAPVSVVEIVVVTDETPPWPPCGFCRQVLSEFGSPETQVVSANLKGESVSNTFGELFPNAFTPAHLKK
jgi:cytidine deaminase